MRIRDGVCVDVQLIGRQLQEGLSEQLQDTARQGDFSLGRAPGGAEHQTSAKRCFTEVTIAVVHQLRL